MKYRNLVKAVIFLTILAILLNCTQEILRAKWGIGTAGARETLNYWGFYDEPEQSLDVIYLGSSQIFYGVSPMTIWREYGIPGYAKGSANQSIYLSYYSLLDALRKQSPKVVVLDVFFLFSEFSAGEMEWVARRALDYMQISPAKLEAIRNLELDGTEQTYLSYVFPLIRYHSRWKELTSADIEYFSWEHHYPEKGQFMGTQPLEFELPSDYMKESETIAQSPQSTLEYFNKIVSLCRENNIQLVLIKTPAIQWNYSKYLGAKRLAEENNLVYIDYNLPEYWDQLDLDITEDFYYTSDHLSVLGAEKLSVHLGGFLQQKYNLPDKRSLPAYNSWEEDLAIFRKKMDVRVD